MAGMRPSALMVSADVRILKSVLLRRMRILPESPVRSLFPSGRCCRPPRRQILKPGPFGARFFSVPTDCGARPGCAAQLPAGARARPRYLGTASRRCHAARLHFGHKRASRKSHGYNRSEPPPGAHLPYVDSRLQPEKLRQIGGAQSAGRANKPHYPIVRFGLLGKT